MRDLQLYGPMINLVWFCFLDNFLPPLESLRLTDFISVWDCELWTLPTRGTIFFVLELGISRGGPGIETPRFQCGLASIAISQPGNSVLECRLWLSGAKPMGDLFFHSLGPVMTWLLRAAPCAYLASLIHTCPTYLEERFLSAIGTHRVGVEDFLTPNCFAEKNRMTHT